MTLDQVRRLWHKAKQYGREIGRQEMYQAMRRYCDGCASRCPTTYETCEAWQEQQAELARH